MHSTSVTVTTVSAWHSNGVIHRGLHGEYGFDVHGFSLLTIGIIPFICVFLLRGNQFRLPLSGLCVLATVLVTCMVLYYLSSNGLWCAQHPSARYARNVRKNEAICIILTSNFHSWWLTLCDLLAIQRARAMPMVWEHDIDICINPKEIPRVFEVALACRAGYFVPKPIHYGKGHWYIYQLIWQSLV
jgi:hypothetical protein